VTQEINVKRFIEQRILEISQWFPHKILNYSLDITKGLQYRIEENTFGVLIDNLISNAIKFAPDDMKIEVIANEKYFQIWDNGPWIPVWDRTKIWEKFYRIDINKEWFWVGLYLVARIVNIYNWKVEIISPKKWGTIFKVDIRNDV
jgi:K+-sensing histidine kinase KdpD